MHHEDHPDLRRDEPDPAACNGKTAAAWSWPAAAAGAGDRVLAQPGAHLLAADPHQRRRAGLVLPQPARRRAGQRPGPPGRQVRQRRDASAAGRRRRRGGLARLHHLEHAGQPGGPGRHAGWPALWAEGPHRRHLHPSGIAMLVGLCTGPGPPASSPLGTEPDRRPGRPYPPPWPGRRSRSTGPHRA